MDCVFIMAFVVVLRYFIAVIFFRCYSPVVYGLCNFYFAKLFSLKSIYCVQYVQQ